VREGELLKHRNTNSITTTTIASTYDLYYYIKITEVILIQLKEILKYCMSTKVIRSILTPTPHFIRLGNSTTSSLK